MRLLRLSSVVVLCVVLAGACSGKELPEQASDLLQKAARSTDQWVEQDWEGLRSDFDENMRTKLTADLLAQGWDSIQAMAGVYESRDEPRIVGDREGFTVVDTPMFFAMGEFKSRVSFRPNGQIAGFFILRPDVT